MDVESELEKERELILGGGEVIVGRSGGWLYIPLCTLFSLFMYFVEVFLSRFKLGNWSSTAF